MGVPLRTRVQLGRKGKGGSGDVNLVPPRTRPRPSLRSTCLAVQAWRAVMGLERRGKDYVTSLNRDCINALSSWEMLRVMCPQTCATASASHREQSTRPSSLSHHWSPKVSRMLREVACRLILERATSARRNWTLAGSRRQAPRSLALGTRCGASFARTFDALAQTQATQFFGKHSTTGANRPSHFRFLRSANFAC